MPIVKMQKVALIAHRLLRENVLEFLHDRGVMEITTNRSGAQEDPTAALAETLTREQDIDHTKVRYEVSEIRSAIQFLTPVAPPEILAEINGSHRNVDDIRQSALNTDFKDIVDQCQALENSVASLATEEEFLITQQKTLEPWKELPYKLDLQGGEGFRSLVLMLGICPVSSFSSLQSDIRVSLPESEVLNIGAAGSQAMVAALLLKDDKDHFTQIASRHGWTVAALTILERTPAQELLRIRQSMRTMEGKKREIAMQRRALAQHLPALYNLLYYLKWLDEKQSAREKIAHTAQTIHIMGWVPASEFASLQSDIEKLYPATLLIKEKPTKGELVPIQIRNRHVVAPFEAVTRLYGLPQSHEFDPTGFLAPFFILFFALCLTDAGYGAFIAITFGIFLWRTKKSIEEAKLLWLLFFSGIITIIVSIPFGGWFGLSPDQVPSFLTRETPEGRLFLGQIWNLSNRSGVNFLQNLSMVLGLSHLFFGMFLAGVHKWIHEEKIAAFWMNFTPHILLGAVILSYAYPSQITQYILYGSIVLLVWGKGHGTAWYLRPIMGLLGTVNFAIGILSNSLSYLRILALGLVTGAIATAMNQVAVEIGALFPTWLSIPVIIILFVVGHVISIALNTLGSFIHSSRLQFIEFFSQFFEGGGQEFAPFRRTLSR